MAKEMYQVFDEDAKGDENEANSSQSPDWGVLQRTSRALSSSSGSHDLSDFLRQNSINIGEEMTNEENFKGSSIGSQNEEGSSRRRRRMWKEKTFSTNLACWLVLPHGHGKMEVSANCTGEGSIYGLNG
ncbi:unnamed protein product, partial [Ilex paraguariensis]